jgi:hypothetical protein
LRWKRKALTVSEDLPLLRMANQEFTEGFRHPQYIDQATADVRVSGKCVHNSPSRLVISSLEETVQEQQRLVRVCGIGEGFDDRSSVHVW